MKKAILGAIALALCAAGTSAADAAKPFETGIKDVAVGIANKLPQGAKLVVLDIKVEGEKAEAYLVDQLTYELLNTDRLVLVDRENLEKLRRELSFQNSGEVSDDSSQRLGAMLGAESIVTGSFERNASGYRLAVKVLKVETAEIQYMKAINLTQDRNTDIALGYATAPAADDGVGKAVGQAAVGVLDFTGRLICSAINPVFGIGSFIQGDGKAGGSVVFWELAGAGCAAAGVYWESDLLQVIGGVAVVGAVIGAFIAPWTYNRTPKVAEALEHVNFSITQTGFTAGFTVPLN